VGTESDVASSRLLREVLDQMSPGVVVWELVDPDEDASLTLVYVNAAASRLLGIDVGALVGQPMSQVLPAVPPERRHAYAEVCRDRKRREFSEITYADERVQAVLFSVVATPVLERCVLVTFESLTQLKRMEAEARSVSRFLDSIIEHMPAMVFMKDAKDLRFERFNRAGEDLLGLSRDEMIGKTDYDFFPRDQADFFVQKDRGVLERGTLEDIPEEPIQTPHGTRWLHTRKIPISDAEGRAAHLLGISIDITEQREAELMKQNQFERQAERHSAELKQQIEERVRAEAALARSEEQFRQAQKMEAIGRLAGGIAHDFNNLLSVILSYSQLALHSVHDNDVLQGELEQILLAGQRAAELTRQLLAFSRQQVLQPRTLDLGEVVRGMERLLRRLLGEDVELAIGTSPQLGSVRADRSQIEQVVMNLVVNARDAMPTGGKLTIETANVDLDELYVASHLGAVVGPHVMIAVADTGTGMNREIITRIFEPFFTTKEPGKGTGLGLSTVLGIVQQSGGSIWVYSEPGHGAVFKVYLPTVADVDDSQRSPISVPPRTLHGAETILLVEDEEQVRTLAAAVLRRIGYRVLEASVPSQALALASRHPGTIDLLLTDVVMPEMGGRSLAEMLVARRPGLRVLFMSGYTDDAIVRHGVLESGVAFLQKPLTPDVLALRVRQALDRRPSGVPPTGVGR
jgi:PAS domain S-box-containing protein